MKNKTLQPYLWILTSGFVFSWMVTFAVLAGRGTNWQVVAVSRCVIPFVVIAAWARFDGVKLVFFGSPTLWIRSLAGSCSLVATFFAISIMPVTDIYTISNIFPIWVALLSWPMFGRFPSGIVWLSIFSSILGVAIIQGAELQTGNYGVFVVIGISLFTAVAMLGLNRLKNIDPRAIVVHFSGTALIVSLMCMAIFPWQKPREEFMGWHAAELIGVGLTAAMGQYYLTKAFTAGDPAHMSVATLSQFVFIMIFDVVLLGNPLVLHKLIGIPLILGPTIWLMLRRVKKSALATEARPESQPAVLAPTEGEWAVCADSTACNDSK